MDYRKLFNFDLDIFQKKAIESINKYEDVLVTAHTGSGKTVPAEYAINDSIKNGKRVIYTSPIKSLSNQKFFEFKKKYPNITFGILTGDIKFNPNAQCIIMTTEILKNLLYNKNLKLSSNISTEIDISKDVETVIFDEVHYINDLHRGKVWEECIILLPKNIRLVMLSATIDNSLDFCKWIEDIKGKKVNLYSTNKRVVPLTHYIFMDAKNKLFKGTKNDLLLDKYTNKLIPILDSNNIFYQKDYEQIYKISLNINKYVNRNYISSKGALNPIITYLKTHNLLPAIFFVFSRAKCEDYASNISISLNDLDNLNEVNKNVTYYLSLLKNNYDYKKCSQYIFHKKMWEKGIAVHHSGLMPVFKEIIELLFSKGLIKVLFATETFAVGVNMPTKTVLYAGISKYDSTTGFRNLYTHEYLQMSGRAGRRGMDHIGHVIHLPNFYEILPTTEFKNIIKGKSQGIVSKFSLNYQFILKNILTTNTDILPFIQNSLLNKEIKEDIQNTQIKLNGLEYKNIDNKDLYDEYYYLTNPDPYIKDSKKDLKRRKERKVEIENISNFNNKYVIYLNNFENNSIINKYKEYIVYCEKLLENNAIKVLNFLKEEGYIKIDNIASINDVKKDNISLKGIIASEINECNEILLTEMIVNGCFDKLSIVEIIALLSIFSDVKVSEEDEKYDCNIMNISSEMKQSLTLIDEVSKKYYRKEEISEINLNNNWDINLNLIEYIISWLNKDNKVQLPIFEGNFIKNMLQILNIAFTIENVLDIVNKVELKPKFSSIPSYILKEEVTIDSLYIYL